MVLGSGPIVIGQGCEFDYSGTQACRALLEESIEVVLVNPNPATIMTDPEFSNRTYIEPLTTESVERIIRLEQKRGTPLDAILPTLGGQTALNTACALDEEGIFKELGIEMIGADRKVINRAEDREKFRDIIESVGLSQARAKTIKSLQEGFKFIEEIGLPAVIRPAFTLGGSGGGIAYNMEEFEDIVRRGLDASRIGQVLIDESLLGWKEFELEVVRDSKDNCVIVCGIENIDPMGVHTGDSITVAPIMTLTDRQYQRMRDAALSIIRAIGVETGGSNVQFAVNPKNGDMVVIEMNPRVSRSSALASKATGFPIARIAAKLAVGYTLDELRNDITETTSACFEPSIDYVVTKMPRWTFEKFPEADQRLTTQMKSVGEAMAIGRTFKESLQKAIRSMEVKRFGLGLDNRDAWLRARRGEDNNWPFQEDKLIRKLSVPSQGRLYYIRYAILQGWSIERINDLTGIDKWFLNQIKEIVDFEKEFDKYKNIDELPKDVLREAKVLGFSDAQIASYYFGDITSNLILKVREYRKSYGIEPVYKLVDTCAAEFEAITPYFYSSYENSYRIEGKEIFDDEIRVTDSPKVIILGGGPNRIGQGIEFDYCCVQAAFACSDENFESVMINSNPETVSTDYDISDMLFFEPLTLEDVLNIIERLNGGGIEVDDRSGGVVGIIVQFGGQTPLNLAEGLNCAGVPILGTSLKSLDSAEDRDQFRDILQELNFKQPASGIARGLEEALSVADDIGYPVLVRPSYVLGGRGMEICFDAESLSKYMAQAIDASDLVDAPILVDSFLSEATEVDIDVMADFTPSASGTNPSLDIEKDESSAIVCGVMEHIEEAGVHSGDSSCVIPPFSLSNNLIKQVKYQARKIAERLKVRGLMNVQMALKNDEIYILEVNPRASRTVPFVAKSKNVPWPRLAARIMLGRSLKSLGAKELKDSGYHAVKEPAFPFTKFPGTDVVLGPEMRSTGEVMGADRSLPVALAKAKMSVGNFLPKFGRVFISVRDLDKPHIIEVARRLKSMDFKVVTTSGTKELLERHSIAVDMVRKISEGARPNIIDRIANGEIDLIINTPTRKGGSTDEGRIRAMAVRYEIPMITTIPGAIAAVDAIAALRAGEWHVAALQDYVEEEVSAFSL